ncbi:hypothetical protein JD844_002066 [Phrynosoma platyrhinos]|uniref:SMARCD2 n=1 Tax=Phrynosoma platyrhinos TaxID=52577 RepID=A0ABQ7TBL9_PHRPL|nr:hypothetical protein JD844_002066 [Phrynosoma platyrhinos]
MLPGGRMPMTGLQVGAPSGPPYGTASPMRPGLPQSMIDPFRKRLLVPQTQPPSLTQRRGYRQGNLPGHQSVIDKKLMEVRRLEIRMWTRQSDPHAGISEE